MTNSMEFGTYVPNMFMFLDTTACKQLCAALIPLPIGHSEQKDELLWIVIMYPGWNRCQLGVSTVNVHQNPQLGSKP